MKFEISQSSIRLQQLVENVEEKQTLELPTTTQYCDLDTV